MNCCVPEKLLGRSFCVLARHHIHWDQAVLACQPLSQLLRMLFHISWSLKGLRRYLDSQYPFYLYLVKRFTTGQSNIVHAWTKIELQSDKKLRNISHPLDRELLVGCPVLLRVTKPQRVPLLQLSERCSCTKRVQVRPRKSS